MGILAMLPIIWLIVALTGLKMAGHKACLIALVITIVEALFLWQMPAIDCATSAVEGFASALWPIILVIIAAIFTYNLTLKTGAMDVIKQMLTGVSADQRVQVLLIGWCFGGFMEGMAGFGTAIAIPASMLAAMGINPLTACLVCMLANAFPTAFGSVGIPTVTLSNVTGLDPLLLAFTTVLQMVPFMILVPFLMVIVGGGGLKALKGMVGITLVSGVTFVAPQLAVARFIGPELAVIVGCVVSLGCTILMARARKNAPVPEEYNMKSGQGQAKAIDGRTALVSWMPFILIFALLLVTSKLAAPVNNALAVFSSSIQISTSANAGATSFSWVNTPGIWIFLAAIIGGLIQKASGKVMWETLVATVKQMSKTIVTIMSVLAVAKIMTYCGMIDNMAALFVGLTGSFFPFVSPIIGALGAFITGSGTSTEVLLGALQTSAAEQIGVSSFWLAAANSTGAGIGKVISPQCIATAAAAVGLVGQDSKLLGGMIKWVVLELVLASLIIGLLGGILPPILGLA
ncbi:L-lactate permease [uncultured Intestinimonas sp.]|uniref:L-lactate permease n=1 Tax=uncultured Intestinimonas sp. TaxID=1689265 RepID=UPI0025E502E0|nr:L-lactate permease [uncultured Intestinimonas sp.]